MRASFLLLTLAGCSPQKLPDIPNPPVDSFAPSIRKAVQCAVEEAHRHPESAEASGRLGMVLHAYDQNEAAEAAYLRAHQLDRQSFRWSYYLALIQEAQGDRPAAAARLRRALRLAPDYIPGRLRLAELLLDNGDFQQSERAFRQLLAENANIAAAYYGLGRALSNSGDLPGAIEAWKKACELHPDYGAAHHALAAAYRKCGRPDDARLHAAVDRSRPVRRETIILSGKSACSTKAPKASCGAESHSPPKGSSTQPPTRISARFPWTRTSLRLTST